MKKTSLFLLFIALLSSFIATTVQAQSPTERIETLIVDLWPDYDKPSVLVLLTGTLSADTPLPATVSIPLPDNAELHAIARITSDNRMLDDLEYNTENNILTFTTPDPRFRAEYYAPYETNGTSHSFSFDWLANLRVENMVTAVQQPSNALTMHVIPENAAIVSDSTDGFTYYTFPPQAIPAGNPYIIRFDYVMPSPSLSAPAAPTSNTNANPAPVPTSAASTSFPLDNINWGLVAGLLAVILTAVFITWQVATRKTQPEPKSRKPSPKRNTPAAKARFCHQCGAALRDQDKFCRVCGTAVKTS